MEFLLDIERKLNGVDDFYIKYAEIKMFDKATPGHHERVLGWVITRCPIYEDERGFLFHRDDFMTTKKTSTTSNENSRVHGWIESWLAQHPKSMFKVSINLTPLLPARKFLSADSYSI